MTMRWPDLPVNRRRRPLPDIPSLDLLPPQNSPGRGQEPVPLPGLGFPRQPSPKPVDLPHLGTPPTGGQPRQPGSIDRSLFGPQPLSQGGTASSPSAGSGQGQDNPYLDWLEDNEIGNRASFMSRLPGGSSANQQRFAGNQFQNWLDRYLGALGSQARSGQAPSLSWDDFLNQNFNFQNEFRRAPVEQSGLGTRGLAGRARYLYNF